MEDHMRKRFELGKRADGKLNRWESRSAKSLGLLDLEAPYDYSVQVVTAVHKNRREAFANGL
jgi:hypothetical protein